VIGRRPGARVATLGLLALLACACSRAAQAPVPEPEATSATPVPQRAAADGALLGMERDEVARRSERGRSVYARWRCGSCHSSADALPGLKVKPLEHLADRYDVTSLDAWIRAPRKPMPTYPIRDDDRRSLAVYLLTSEGERR
jgi:mono/diheme cytochrome c family protein